MPDDEQEMHRQVDWFMPSDRAILAEIKNYDGWLKPASIHLNIGYSQQHVQERCRELWQRGLLQRYGENTAGYKVTELAVRLLDDELSPEDLQRLTAEDEGPYRPEE